MLRTSLPSSTSRQLGLVAQLDEHGEVQHARAPAGGAWRGSCRRGAGVASSSASQSSCARVTLAVVVAGHGGVERDHAQAVDVVHAVDGSRCRVPRRTAPARKAARSSWLPITQITAAPSRAATGSTMRSQRA